MECTPAKLIYLDSAQFDSLERADPAGRAEFFSVWNNANCELALTLHHIQEMGQLGDKASLARRLEVLQHFVTIRCLPASSVHVLRFEVQELFAHDAISEERRLEVRESWFPRLADRSGLTSEVLRTQFLFHGFASAMRMGADAETLSKEARQASKKTSAKQLRMPTNDSDWDELYAWSRSQVELEAQSGSRVHQYLSSMFDAVFALARQHGNLRSLLTSIYGLSDVRILKHIPDEDLTHAQEFYGCAREEAVSIAKLENLDARTLIDRAAGLNMYEAPGFRLKLAAQRARRQSPKTPEAGDQIDEAHLMFAPYVDLLIADKRTVGFVSQRTKHSFSSLPPEAVTNIRRVADLQECCRLIAELKAEPLVRASD